MERYKISKLLNESAVSNFVAKIGLKYMIHQVVNILLTKI